MSSTPQFAPLLTAYGWMVSVPVSMSGDGRRRKKYFQTETEAKKFAGRLRASWLSGVRNAVMPAEVARQAMEAMRVLDGSGISLIEAARMAADSVKADHGSELFSDRLARCITAGERYWSARYATDMGSVARWVAPWLMEMRCGAITQAVGAIDHRGAE